MYDLYRITKNGSKIYWVAEITVIDGYTIRKEIERYINAHISLIDGEQYFAIARGSRETSQQQWVWQWRVSTKPQLISV